MNIKPPLLKGNSCSKILETIDCMFKSTTKKTYTNFCILGGRLMSFDERDKMINMHKSLMTNHCETTKQMMGIDSKEQLTKNKTLVDNGFYDRRLFYHFLSQTRLKNPRSCVWWGVIGAAASHGHGSSTNCEYQTSICLGTTCSIRTFLKNTKNNSSSMPKVTHSLSCNETMIVAAIDNNHFSRDEELLIESS